MFMMIDTSAFFNTARTKGTKEHIDILFLYTRGVALTVRSRIVGGKHF